jgi:hypothetical protein
MELKTGKMEGGKRLLSWQLLVANSREAVCGRTSPRCTWQLNAAPDLAWRLFAVSLIYDAYPAANMGVASQEQQDPMFFALQACILAIRLPVHQDFAYWVSGLAAPRTSNEANDRRGAF